MKTLIGFGLLVLALSQIGCATMPKTSNLQCFAKDSGKLVAEINLGASGPVIVDKDCVIFYGVDGKLKRACGTTCGVRGE